MVHGGVDAVRFPFDEGDEAGKEIVALCSDALGRSQVCDCGDLAKDALLLSDLWYSSPFPAHSPQVADHRFW